MEPMAIQGCSRAFWNSYIDDTIVTGRSMDWGFCFDDVLFVNPRGLEINGGTTDDENVIPTHWVSKYGSAVSSIIGYIEQFGYDLKLDDATDGMNEKGLAFHLLNLDATEYPKPNTNGKPNVSYCRWGRYILDNFATVEEAVEGMKKSTLFRVFLMEKKSVVMWQLKMRPATQPYLNIPMEENFIFIMERNMWS
jgi:penicillin V acylase-like amidase (Ntn superfamily)